MHSKEMTPKYCILWTHFCRLPLSCRSYRRTALRTVGVWELEVKWPSNQDLFGMTAKFTRHDLAYPLPFHTHIKRSLVEANFIVKENHWSTMSLNNFSQN